MAVIINLKKAFNNLISAVKQVRVIIKDQVISKPKSVETISHKKTFASKKPIGIKVSRYIKPNVKSVIQPKNVNRKRR